MIAKGLTGYNGDLSSGGKVVDNFVDHAGSRVYAREVRVPVNPRLVHGVVNTHGRSTNYPQVFPRQPLMTGLSARARRHGIQNGQNRVAAAYK